MARSKIIRQYKDKIVSELSQDDEIIRGLGLNPDESPDDLVWVRLYPHGYISQTESEVKSYITVEVNIPQRRLRYGENSSSIWTHPYIIFRVICHQEDMKLDLAGESGTRMDYLAELVEDKYEGRQDFGVGVLTLISDVAGDINNTYRVRELVFEAVDVSSVCG